MQMTVKDALARLNHLNSRMKENNLTDNEQTEFNKLSSALDRLELPSTRKPDSWVGNYTHKFTSGPTGSVFKDPAGNKIVCYKQHEQFNSEAKLEWFNEISRGSLKI